MIPLIVVVALAIDVEVELRVAHKERSECAVRVAMKTARDAPRGASVQEGPLHRQVGFVKKNVQNAWVRRMKVPIETLHMVLNKHRIPYTLGRQKMHGSPGPFPRWLTEINRLR